MRVAPPAITATHLSLARNGEMLVDDFTFSIPAGSYVAIIGPNGGGKTTFVRVLLGFLQPTSGAVRLFDHAPDDASVRQRVSYVPQRGGLLEQTFPATVDEVIAAGRTQRLGMWGRWTARDHERVAAVCGMMRIAHLRRRVIGSLSGGERQRVLLARALAADPDLLVLDEPIDGLDPGSREEFYAILRQIHAQGTTILFVTHDVHRITTEADSAICLRHELVCHGTHACHISGHELRNIVHRSSAELAEHHGA
ncbi:metal ABC transporter ATP-binding protein [Candidatus Uhrbacteria bacterium]|nr:metal ABC transporter ATP-binding protein [Candidatus Uhrbacteria bacterium]